MGILTERYYYFFIIIVNLFGINGVTACACVYVSLRVRHFVIGRQGSNNMHDCTKRSTPSPIAGNRTLHKGSTDCDALLLLEIKMDYNKRLWRNREVKLRFSWILHFPSMW